MKVKLRIARATNDLKRISKMYSEGLGLSILGSFENHDGFDGVMLGHEECDYHFEFTREHSGQAPRSNSVEQLIVFYVGNAEKADKLKLRMINAGFSTVKSHNPYWEQHGHTIEDFEGYRVDLCHRSWGAV